MGNKIEKAKLIIFLTVLLEIILTGTFVVFYLTGLFGLKEILNKDLIITITGILVLLSCVTIWVVVGVIANSKLRSDIKTKELLSSDIEEIYNFGQIAMVVTDDENRVIWTSELFQYRHIDIIGQDILAWKPQLEVLMTSLDQVKETKLTINNRTYDVQLIRESNLWIFKDVTDYQTAYVYSKQNAVVFGILNIDNYDSVTMEDIVNDTENRLKSLIHGYFKDFNVVFRKIKEDSYFLICNYLNYARMKSDNFSIVDKVRALNFRDTNFSLSIGFAYDYPDLMKLNDYAFDALDVALSRGGDQVVVFPYGRQIEFYGGKTVSAEKTNRVKIRSLSDSVFSLIKNSSNVLIMGHTLMDMDAFGACLGMKAICDRVQKEVKIVADLKMTESKTRSAIMSSFNKNELQELLIGPRESLDLVKQNTLVIVVDVHVPSMVMAPELLEKSVNTMVIDHHRRGKDYIESTLFSHIDSSASSACEIVAEFIKFCSINPVVNLPSIYATFMLSGIFLDSTYFKAQSTGLRTFEAAAILKDYAADNAMADDFLKDDIEEHKEINEFVDSLKMPVKGIAIVTPKEDRIYDQSTIAKACNEVLTFKGTHAVFSIARISNKDIKVSCRSDGSVNVQLISERLGGGGSFERAAVVFENISIQEAFDKIVDCIKKNLDAAQISDKKGNQD
ncbi:MAG: DHH family phosphoesterase [Bacilli bacterium]|nr:DHH family phosphoesterase [Bacilli bacterium]